MDYNSRSLLLPNTDCVKPSWPNEPSRPGVTSRSSARRLPTLRPPVVEATLGGGDIKLGFGPLELEQELQGLANGTTGGEAQSRHDGCTIEQRSLGRAAFLLVKRRDTSLELIDVVLKLEPLLRVPGGAIRSDELVQGAEQMTGVAGVSANGGIRPAIGIPLEAPGEADELCDIGHELIVEAQLAHPPLGHLGADRLVVTERHAPVLERAGPRLADVMEQRAQAQPEIRSGLGDHRDGVGEDVLVTVDRVLFEPQRRKLR